MSTSKVPIGTVADVIKSNGEVPPDVARKIIEELNARLQVEDEEEKLPAVKKQYAILVSDPEGNIPPVDLVGWVLQLPENESIATTTARINRAAYDFNASKKGRLLPVRTVGEAIENVPARFFKQADVWVKTKTPVLVLRTDNNIPREVKETAA